MTWCVSVEGWMINGHMLEQVKKNKMHTQQISKTKTIKTDLVLGWKSNSVALVVDAGAQRRRQVLASMRDVWYESRSNLTKRRHKCRLPVWLGCVGLGGDG